MFFTPDTKDIVYTIFGLSFLLLALYPLVKGQKIVSAPILFIITGAMLSFIPVDIALLNVTLEHDNLKLIEHSTELLVIISLAGAGLAIDRPIGFKRWQHTWILLLCVMPLTIISVALIGHWVIGLSVITSLLLAAAIAPTDPVLARSVQVEGPNKGEENDVNVSLTAEAGLNDGLAFPFIYFAIAAANAGLAFDGTMDNFDWLWKWLAYDLLYRVGLGVIIGCACGLTIASLLHEHSHDEIQHYNAGLALLAGTFVTYGIAEFFDGYGFLAVFIAAITGRTVSARRDKQQHTKKTHYFSDQAEQIIMALLLLWLGYYAASTGLDNVTIVELLSSVCIVLILRPAVGYLFMAGSTGSKLDRFAIAFLGIRGIGSFYYLAYAQSHYTFLDMDVAWRIATLCVLISIMVHGIFAHRIMRVISNRE